MEDLLARSPDPVGARAEADVILDTLIGGLRDRTDPAS